MFYSTDNSITNCIGIKKYYLVHIDAKLKYIRVENQLYIEFERMSLNFYLKCFDQSHTH